MTIWAVTVPGDPAPKGSMKCVGKRGKGSHQLVEDDKTGRGKRWRAKVTAAGVELRRSIGDTLDGPLGLAVLTVANRPAAAKDRPLPHFRSSHDADKLARMIGDALDDADVYADDSRICWLTSSKVYETEGRAPGATIILWPLLEETHTMQVTRHLLGLAPELN